MKNAECSQKLNDLTLGEVGNEIHKEWGDQLVKNRAKWTRIAGENKKRCAENMAGYYEQHRRFITVQRRIEIALLNLKSGEFGWNQ